MTMNECGDLGAEAADFLAAMMRDAAQDSTGRRTKTLERLREACDDILSGRAYQLARDHEFEDAKRFRPPHRKVVAEAVDDYVRMRRAMEGCTSNWTGPKKRTIRGSRGMCRYLALRTAAASETSKPRRRTRRSDQLEEAIDRIDSMTARNLLRRALEEGREDRNRLNLAREILRQLAGIDLTGDLPNSLAEMGERRKVALDGDDRRTLEKFIGRITDPEQMATMGLVFRTDRLKLAYPPGSELIDPATYSLLMRLAQRDGGKASW